MVKDKKSTFIIQDAPLSDRISPLIYPSDYFGGGVRGYDPGLSSALCALSLSASDDRALAESLSRLGFEDIVTTGSTEQKPHGAGMMIAKKPSDDLLYVLVIIKGTQGKEWYSNFDIGYSAEHRGFSRAADLAELSLGDYVFTRAIGSEPRFIITGYSRGGAVADILAKRLCERYGTDSVRAYTFASPNVTISRRSSGCGCIYNLVRDEDIFTRVPLEGWGYSRYGRDIRLKTTDGFTEQFRKLSGNEYIGFTEVAPVDSLLCAVMKLAPNVHAYYKRRREVGDRRLSLCEFMRMTADILSAESEGEAADIFMSAMISEYADLVGFMTEGSDLEELLTPAAAAPRCSAADSHSPAAYTAALEEYNRQLKAEKAASARISH